MDEYTNQISDLKELPILSQWWKSKKRKRREAAVKEQQKKAVKKIVKAKKEAAAKVAKREAGIQNRDKKIDALETDSFDREFSEYTIAYTPPKAKKATTKRPVKEVFPEPPMADIIPPTPEEEKLYRQYDTKGIFFKTNLPSVVERDLNGNVLVTIGEEINKSVKVNGDAVIIETIPAPKSGHGVIPININRKD